MRARAKCLPKNSMPVDAGMLEIDPRGAVRTHNDLQLIIPPIRARPHLHTRLQVIRSAQEVAAQFRKIASSGIIQTHHEQRIVHDLQA